VEGLQKDTSRDQFPQFLLENSAFEIQLDENWKALSF
jgi:hypothetical protein